MTKKKLCMRALVMITGLCLNVGFIYAHAQTTGFPREKITERLERISKESKGTGQMVSFKVPENKDVMVPSYQPKTNNMEEWLSHSLEDTDLVYKKVNDHMYSVFEKEEAPVMITQQNSALRGQVTDQGGTPLIGVNVMEKGTTNGTITNIDGNFFLEAPADAMIVFSYIGYSPKELPRNGASVLDVVLQEDSELLEELVVIGYGTQKKVNLSGAVDQIDSKVFENRPIPNISRGLQGVIPNLNLTMYDGNPTRSPEFNIRGTTSIGAGGNALVLIDGIESDPSTLNPNDIASISVLKDASSAAVYGARGAFGVVLITTKSPSKGKVSVTYSGNISVNKRTVTPDLVTDGYQWAKMFNEAHLQWYGQNPTAINSAFPFSQEYLKELERRSADPSLPKYEIDSNTGRYIYYDRHDWLKDLYKDSNPSTEHSLNISGGNEKATYYLSGRYYSQDGIYRYNSDDYKTYNLRAKGDIQVAPWLKVYDNVDVSVMDYNEPLYYGGYGFSSEISMGWSMRAFPVSPMLNEDGTITEMGARSIGDLYYGKNKAESKTHKVTNITGFTATFLNNALKVSGDVSYSYRSAERTRNYSAVPYSIVPDNMIWLGSSKYFNKNTSSNYYAANIYSEFNKQINSHSFKILAGFNGESYSEKALETSRDGILDPDNPGFTLANGQVYTAVDELMEWVVRGGFFRIGYDYKQRYIFEMNGRYDGSSKFPENERYAFFPSLSAAWRISEESFWKLDKDHISNLKLRGSYGSLGNGNIAPYKFLETMPVGTLQRLIGNEYPTYTKMANLIPDNLTWETVTTGNIGMDVTLLKDRLSITADAYKRNTKGMFTPGPTLPEVLGTDVPLGNYADLETKGWEISIGWNDRIKMSKPLNYGLRFVLADNKATITKYNNPTLSLDDYYEGMQVGEIWGYVTEGLFKDQADIDSHVRQDRIRSNNAGIIYPGDVKFRNLDGDDEISYGDNTVTNPGDRKIIGNSQPRYTYGIQLNADWNNFALSCFFQGVGKRDWYPPSESFYFWGQYNRPYSPLPTHILNNYYNADPDHPDPDAYFPRYSGLIAYSSNGSLSVPQTRYLQDASYIRLKNITLAYTIPLKETKWAEKINVYITGQNLWTYSGLFKTTKNIDPETIESINPDTNSAAFGGGNGYPILKTVTLGTSITF